jgi:hypothetical protein
MPADAASTLDVLALLPLPPLHTLTERQVRGIDCVYDAIPLAPTTAIDLGARPAQRAGLPVTWYPRACRRCVGEAALRALHGHAPECGERGEEITCPVCRALLRLIRDGGRR